MAGRTRVVIIRMKQGGLLMVAPAAVFPWPRLLSRNARHLQPAGLRRALNDPKSMQILRSEYPQMLNLPVPRGSGLISDHKLIESYQTSANRGYLTIIFGHTESSYAEHPKSQPLSIVFKNNPIIAEAASKMTHAGDASELPHMSVPMPRDYDERLMWVIARTPSHMDIGDYERFKEFFNPKALSVTAAILLLWASSHVVGVGFVVDAALFAHIMWQNGPAALRALEDLKKFFDLTRDPGNWQGMDDAAEYLANAITALGPISLRQLLRRIGHGAAARGGGKNISPPLAPRGSAATRRADELHLYDADAGPVSFAEFDAGLGKDDPPPPRQDDDDDVAQIVAAAISFLLPRKKGGREPGAVPLTPALDREIKQQVVRKAGPPLTAPGMPDLSAEDAATFKNGVATPQTYPPGTKLYRVIDADSSRNGSFWTTEKPESEAQWRADGAVKNDFNGDGGFVEYTVPAEGLTAWTGPAAPQYTSDQQAALPGGGPQIWVPPGSLSPGPPQPTPWNGGEDDDS